MTVFRAGEQGRYWYAVLGGSLEVRYHAPDTESKVSSLNTHELELIVNYKMHTEQAAGTLGHIQPKFGVRKCVDIARMPWRPTHFRISNAFLMRDLDNV